MSYTEQNNKTGYPLNGGISPSAIQQAAQPQNISQELSMLQTDLNATKELLQKSEQTIQLLTKILQIKDDEIGFLRNLAMRQKEMVK